MLYEFAHEVAIPVLLVTLVGGLVALGLSVGAIRLRSRPAPDHYRWPYAALAVIIAAGLGWLLLYATGTDTYYHSGDVSRWDHVARDGGGPLAVVIAAIAIALIAIVELVLCAVSPRRARLSRLVMPFTALACAALLVAAFALTAGH